MSETKIVVITGTDTGVGKTFVTASLLHHLRREGRHALAMKPFCSGSRADVDLLQSIQRHEIRDDEVNPFYFREPLAPLVAARQAGRRPIHMDQVIRSIQHVAAKCDWLLIEGAGGLLAPLGPQFTALELIESFPCNVCVVAANKLGTINHTLLTWRAFPTKIRRTAKLVLNQPSAAPDRSAKSNAAILAELLGISVIAFPYLGPRAATATSVRRHSRLLWPALNAILGQET